VTVSDFNNDAKLDLVTVNNNKIDNSISVLLGNRDGTFQDQMMYPTGAYPVSTLSADPNNDTKLDLAVTNADDNSVSVLLGNGNSTFQDQIMHTVGSGAASVTMGTFKDDNKLDLAVTAFFDNNITILLNSCS
jgi:hypothetical protein